MSNGAAYAPSVQMADTSVWMIGGRLTEKISVIISNDGSGWTKTPGPTLPIRLDATCAVKINSTHVFIGSGTNYAGAMLRGAWIYSFSANTWTALPSMTHSRRQAGCGLAGNTIVVFGSHGGAGYNSTEVLNLDTLEWSFGQQFPSGFGFQRTIPYRTDTFLAFGAHVSGEVSSDSIFQYVPGTKGWIRRPETLPYGGSGALAVVVPPEVAPCT